jgi:hypothetical protein
VTFHLTGCGARGPISAGPAVVFDVDGVLSDATHRQHFLEGPGMYWDSFFMACGEDPLIAETARMGQLLDADYRVVLLTARPIRVRPQTLRWLGEHDGDVRWDLLIMRDEDDWGSSRSYKSGVLRDLQRPGFRRALGPRGRPPQRRDVP